MKILFLTLLDFDSFLEHNIYCDLLREFIRNNHDVYCISPVERRFHEKTHFNENGRILKLKIGNMQKTNLIEKGISTLSVESRYISAIKSYFSAIRFDLVLYSTPPVTFAKTVSYLKKRDGAGTYLLLKDIFPQNAVDINILKKTGVKGIIYRYFKKKEKQLYSISDHIGCMSEANVDYILKHNPEVESTKVEVCPNSIEFVDLRKNKTEKVALREKYKLPTNKKIFVYGGNLGKPQGIPFLINCLISEKENKNVFFLIIGDGTEYSALNDCIQRYRLQNVVLWKRLSKKEYDSIVAVCDIGMIFLDHRFTIPNYPSRLLSYMQAGLPVLACTDTNTDIGKVITNGNFGWWCESNNVGQFSDCIKQICKMDDFCKMSEAEISYLHEFYSVDIGYRTILNMSPAYK